MKQYKHKTGEIAIEVPENGLLARYKVNYGYISANFIENTLDWEEIKDKEYEILKIITLGKNILDTPYIDVDNLLKEQSCQIYSIKRLVDNEIFTIGDKVVFNKIHEFTIKKFYLDCNNRYLLCSNNFGTGHVNITKISKVKKILFTTENGIDIFQNDNFWFIHKYADIWHVKYWDWKIMAEDNNIFLSDKIKFSTKEAAEEYILMNKPCLSIMDIIKKFYEGDSNKWGGIGMPMLTLSKMKELVKTKL